MDYNIHMVEYKSGLHVKVYGKNVDYSSSIKSKHKTLSATDIINQNVYGENSKRLENNYGEQFSMSRTKQNIYKIVRANNWEYFVTLTFNPKMVDSREYVIVRQKLHIWLNNIKKRYAPDLKYFFVPEYHKDKEKLHFHGLISNVGDIPFRDSGRVSIGKYAYRKCDRPNAGTIIFNIPKWRYGFSTATEIIDSRKTSSYITKYVTKDMCNLAKGKHRYLASANLEKARESYAKLGNTDLSEFLKKNQKKSDYVKTIRSRYNKSDIVYLEFGKNVKKEEVAGNE